MKKLIIAVGAIACAIGLQAATVSWGSSGIQTTGDFASGEGDYAGNYAVYLFSSSTTLDFSGDTWQSAFASATKTYLGSAVTDADGAFTASATVSDGNFSGYLVIFDNADYAKANYVFVSGAYTATDNSMHIMALDYDGDTWVNALDYSTAGQTGSKWTAVPEPTSGLLLLVGMAGLALRRRRA